jgi:branched-chain amino acid transport system substrate-binding protein
MEAPRLEEMRLAAIEERIDADVAAGRHEQVVPELERVIAEHPLRERPRMALMLALYRAGRAADALALYRDWQRVLDDELGLAPSPAIRRLEQQILEQDPALEAPVRARLAGKRVRHTRAWAVIAAAVAVLVTVLVASGGGSHHASVVRSAGNAVLALDPVSGALRGAALTGSGPVAVSVGAGAVWVADAGDRTLAKVDPRTRRVVARFGLPAIPSQVLATGAAVWVASPLGWRGTVTRFDPGNGVAAQTATVRHGDDGDAFAPPTPSALAIGAGAVWTNRVRSKLARIAVGGQRTIRDLGPTHSVDGVAEGFGAVWVASSADDRLLRVDPRTLRIITAIPIAGRPGARVAGPLAVALGAGAVWVADAISGTVTRVSPSLDALTATIPVGTHPTRIVARADGVWVITQAGLVRIDPQSYTVTRRVALTGATALALGAGSLWVTTRANSEPRGHAVPRPAAPARPIADGCRPVAGPRGVRPDVLVVSELPTNNGNRASQSSRDARAAMRLVLRRAGFRAGRFAIAYQECDDSTPRDESATPERCAADASAYAAQPSLIALVGPYNSSCAGIELPQLNGASGGPIPVIAPLTTYVGLTKPGPATSADEPQRYYPTGVRNFVRLVGADDRQALAISSLVRSLAARRIALLDDGDGTGYAVRRYLQAAAPRLGLDVAFIASWPVNARDYRPLARRVKAARPDAIVLSGCPCTGGFGVIRDLRRVLGRRPAIVGSDEMTFGYEPLPHRVARTIAGTYITMAGAEPEASSGSGRSLLAAVARGRAMSSLDQIVPQAAAAMQTMLDALRRSDGSRAGVLRALHASNRFDAAGDPLNAPVGVLRYDAAVQYQRSRGAQGLRFVRMIAAPR